MDEDPIVSSVRRVREELASAFDYDVHAIFSDLRQREAGLGDRLVRQLPRRTPKQAMDVSGGSGTSPVDANSASAG